MTETKERKPRKPANPIELYSLEDGNLVPVQGLEVPQNLKSTDALVRWLKTNALVDAKYVFMRKIAGVGITHQKIEVVQQELF